jgi:ketosteroid isomerase-like protein
MPAATVNAKSIVQSVYANLANGKPDAAFALFSDDIEWNEAEGNPLADRNPYRGVNQIAEGVFGRLGAIFEGFAAVPYELIAENDRVIVIARYHGTHRKSGARLDCQAVHSWWVAGGKIVRFQQYADTAQLSRLS